MRPIGLTLAIAALSAASVAPVAWADEAPPICKALHGLADQASRTHEPLRISIAADAAQACRATPDDAITRPFCDAASTATGLAWRLYDCVNTLAAEPQITTTGEHAEGHSRKVITHLAAKLARGVRLDLSVAPDTGHYDVVVWAPK
jgi:hypothetical protein